MRVSGVAFDLEGTVVNVEPAHHEGHIRAARDAGAIITLEEAIQCVKIPHFIGGPDEEVAMDIAILAHGPMSAEEVLARTRRYYELLLGTMTIEPRPGFLKFFEQLKSAGIKMAIGSLTPMEQAKTLLYRSGVGALFEDRDIVLKEDVVNPKPAPDVFVKTAEIMGIDPREQLVFEDSPRGVQAAIAAGSQAIGMPVYFEGEPVRALHRAGALKIFRSWEDVDLSDLLSFLATD